MPEDKEVLKLKFFLQSEILEAIKNSLVIFFYLGILSGIIFAAFYALDNGIFPNSLPLEASIYYLIVISSIGIVSCLIILCILFVPGYLVLTLLGPNSLEDEFLQLLENKVFLHKIIKRSSFYRKIVYKNNKIVLKNFVLFWFLGHSFLSILLFLCFSPQKLRYILCVVLFVLYVFYINRHELKIKPIRNILPKIASSFKKLFSTKSIEMILIFLAFSFNGY